jgi:hypothetical protein
MMTLFRNLRIRTDSVVTIKNQQSPELDHLEKKEGGGREERDREIRIKVVISGHCT